MLADFQIANLANKQEMITPFYNKSHAVNEQGKKVTSYGLSSYGYDIRLGNSFVFYQGEENKMINVVRNGVNHPELIESRAGGVIDPTNFDGSLAVTIRDVDEIFIPPKTYFMGVSMERMKIPRDINVICNGKSTIARAGLQIFVTPLEPEWEGYITLEFFNSTDSFIKLYAGMGISQLQFYRGSANCDVSYADRGGKYHMQSNEPIPPLQLRDRV